ncbi:uncharacterized protein LOC120320113 isoform X4 [Crotalus tigris]|uniref:uncharacterized protein LOC120320113 isoform X4 n=1 Tax=Crotalus tigris TaxID=88082 RepID=UPI00192F24D4|nr:uncharacterized protein LOC120320113 isoform X4 [Crotalus tigris]
MWVPFCLGNIKYNSQSSLPLGERWLLMMHPFIIPSKRRRHVDNVEKVEAQAILQICLKPPQAKRVAASLFHCSSSQKLQNRIYQRRKRETISMQKEVKHCLKRNLSRRPHL